VAVQRHCGKLPPIGEDSAPRSDLDALLESGQIWRALYENSAVGIALLDTDGYFLATNPFLLRMLRYTEQELRHLSFFDVMPEEDRAASRSAFRELLTAGPHEYHRERRYLRKDGALLWVNASVSVIPATAERPRMVVKVIEDLAAQQRLAEALQKSESRFQAILDHSPAMIFLKNLAGRYLLCNREFQKLTRTPYWQVVGKNDNELFPAEQAAVFRANDRLVVQSGAPMAFEEVALHSDGRHTSIVVKFPLRDAAGDIYAVGGIATDITQRKRAEAQTLVLKDQLAAEAAAMVSLHELSTRLLAAGELQPMLEEVLDATIGLLHADFGNIQLYRSESGVLEIVAHRGFRQDFLDYFARVHGGSAACGEAMNRRQRVIVEDVLTDPIFAPHIEIAASAGFRAVQSTPLLSRAGDFLGMISTHFRKPHRPSEKNLRLVDLYARQAAELIEREQVRAARSSLPGWSRTARTSSAWPPSTAASSSSTGRGVKPSG